jgi:hypothetical protein
MLSTIILAAFVSLPPQCDLPPRRQQQATKSVWVVTETPASTGSVVIQRQPTQSTPVYSTRRGRFTQSAPSVYSYPIQGGVTYSAPVSSNCPGGICPVPR